MHPCVHCCAKLGYTDTTVCTRHHVLSAMPHSQRYKQMVGKTLSIRQCPQQTSNQSQTSDKPEKYRPSAHDNLSARLMLIHREHEA